MSILSSPPAGTKRDNWKRVSKRSPCPICGKPDNCTVSTDGGAAWCGRVSDGSIKQNAGGQFLHWITDGQQVTYQHPNYRKPKPKPSINWAEVADHMAAGADHQVERLAELLGVPAWSLDDLGVGHGELNGRTCWSFPERNADGQVIGISRRLEVPTADGKNKLFSRGGSRGLSYAAGWSSGPGPVLLVEGGSDTATGISLGLSVIGRPSNRGGVELLAEMLKHTDRDIIVLGERDEKPDGRWPGQDGARATAKRLAALLGRSVSWSLPPEGSKDLRTWVQSEAPAAAHAARGDLDKLGLFFVSLLDLQTEAPPTDQVEPYKPLEGDLVPLDQWRKRMTTARVDSIDKPGLYVDTSPTGSGKSHADREAMAAAGRSLVILPTHANCAELSRDLVEGGLPAAAHPWLNEANCRNHSEATRAQAAGLSPGAAVCPGCPYFNGCDYISAKREALAADHLVVTHRRASLQPSIFNGRHYVAVHEAADDMLRPTETVDPTDLGAVAQVATEARFNEQDKTHPDLVLVNFFQRLQDAADDLVGAADDAVQTMQLPKPEAVEPPRWWEKRVWRSVEALVSDTTGRTTFALNGAALRLVVGWVTGGLHSLTVQVDHKTGRGGADLIVKRLVGVRLTELPDGVPVWFADATGRAEAIATLTGRSVTDATPAGRLAVQVPAVQVPHDITRRTSDQVVAGWLVGVLGKYPDAVRVGVIGHQPHIEALFNPAAVDLLDKQTRLRLVRWTYYGQGTDRASNEWAAGCDLLICLGTPRVGPEVIRERLVRADQHEAAADPDAGSWGPRRWEGRTADGVPVTVEGRGYADHQWRQAAADQVTAGLRQAVGRGRGCLPGGVLSVVISTEPIGLPILPTDDQVKPIGRAAARATEAVRQCCDSPTFKNSRKNATLKPITTERVAAVLRVHKSNASRALLEAADAGLVERSPKRLGGWGLPGQFKPEGVEPCQNKQAESVPTVTDGAPGATIAKPSIDGQKPGKHTDGAPPPPELAPAADAGPQFSGHRPGADGANTPSIGAPTISLSLSVVMPEGWSTWSEADRVDWQLERAEIMQHDGGLTMAEADAAVGLELVDRVRSIAAAVPGVTVAADLLVAST